MKKGNLESWLIRGRLHRLSAPVGGGLHKALSEFRIFKFGLVETDKGDFQFTRKDAELLLADREGRPRVTFDYEHNALKEEASADEMIGAGSCLLELRDDGLWATDVQYTPKALRQVQEGERIYFSPAFLATKQGRHIQQLINIALTNTPAMKTLGTLIAASRFFTPKERHEMAAHKLGEFLQKHMKKSGLSLAQMAEKCGIQADRMQKLSDGEDPTEEEMAASCKAMGVKDLSAFDGQAPEEADDGSDEDEQEEADAPAKERAAASRRGAELDDDEVDLVKLTGTSDPKRQAARLHAMEMKAKRYDDDHKKLEELSAREEKRERERLVNEGKAAGKLTPGLIKFYAKRDVTELEEFLKHAPVVVNLSRNGGAGGDDLEQIDPKSPRAQLTREELEVCKLSRIDPDEMAKFKAEQAAGKTDAAILATYTA